MSERPRLPIYAKESTDVAFGIGAPLLGGFSVTLIGVLVQLPEDSPLRWRDAAFLALVTAAILYLLSLRYSVAARALRVTDEDICTTWSDQSEQNTARRIFRREFENVDLKARVLFEIASFGLISGIFFVLVPKGDFLDLSPLRIAAVTISGIAAVAQVFQTVLRQFGAAWLPLPIAGIIRPYIYAIRDLPDPSPSEDDE